jgi:hypothetical protein
MDVLQIRARIAEDIGRFDPAANGRSKLAPFRNLIALQRAKGMSYDQIASMFIHRGVSTSVAAVGRFCRVHITRAQLARAKADLQLAARAAPVMSPGEKSLSSGATISPPSFGQSGPRIARDDF